MDEYYLSIGTVQDLAKDVPPRNGSQYVLGFYS
jgi:hypothetical protein